MPTANLKCVDQLIPADGVYAARCTINGTTYAAALSIGTLPTFNEHVRQVEAHILDFEQDLYGRAIEVDVIDWIREQRKFAGVDALKARIERDLNDVRERAGLEVTCAIATV